MTGNWPKMGAVRCLILAAVATVALALPAHAAKRVAFVVGNDNYRNIWPLKKAGGDALTIGEALRGLGFQVLVARDLTRSAMSEQLLVFDSMVEPGDTAMFFFAGHGFEIKGENFLLPIDVPAASEGQEELIKDHAFAAARITERLEARGAKTSILVLDACRNNPFERPGKRSVSGSGGLASMQATSEGTFVMFSAGAKQTALDRLAEDDNNPNSVFTRNFARELKTPGQTLVQIAKRTQEQVKDMALSIRHVQTPAYYDQIVGDVILNGSAADARAPQEKPQLALLPPGAGNAVVRRDTTPNVPSGPVNAPLANFMRHNGGWSVSLSFADPVSVISWRLNENGQFRETGFLDVLDPRTRKRMPNPSFQLDSDTPESNIEIKAIGPNGEAMGPYPIRFEPAAALERGQRNILEMTSGNWLSFREYNGLLVYYTHLVSYRCAIRSVRYAIDSTQPDKVLQLPNCDLKDPSAIPNKAEVHMKLPPTAKSVSVELTYRDGTTSEVKTFRR